MANEKFVLAGNVPGSSTINLNFKEFLLFNSTIIVYTGWSPTTLMKDIYFIPAAAKLFPS